MREYTKGELNKLSPCCLNCEFIGGIDVIDCQLTNIPTITPEVKVCDRWDINMDIADKDTMDSDVVLY